VDIGLLDLSENRLEGQSIPIDGRPAGRARGTSAGGGFRTRPGPSGVSITEIDYDATIRKDRPCARDSSRSFESGAVA
jgi:hypothetical protein